MAGIPYHLDSQQWLLADEFMQAEASKPLHSRHIVSVVVRHIRKNCFHRAAKTITPNGIKKRYETYFLGPGQFDGSLVELADSHMDSAAMGRPKPISSELAKEIRENYFSKSPSALHTQEAIESRYIRVFLKWEEAYEQMRYASRNTYRPGKTFRIGAVVDHIKGTFFSTDPSITEAHIQARYCRSFLGIENTAEAVQKYDDRRVAQEWSVPRREERPSRPTNRLNPAMQSAQVYSSTPFIATEPLARHQEIPQPSTVLMQGPVSVPASLRGAWLPLTSPPSTMLMQETVSGPASLRAHRLPPTSPSSSARYPSAPSSVNSHKRLRQNSFDSSSSMAPSQSTGRSSYTNFSHPQLNRLEMQLRDSGFFSNSSASDTTSLLSRFSRLSIEVKLCEMDHTGMGPGNPCSICQYPESRPKPCVYVAPEYAAPQRADVVDRDDMDNGVMTRNADARL